MRIETLVKETIELQDINRVSLTGYGELVIQQGEEETLSIETDPDLLSGLYREIIQGKLYLGQGGTLMDKLGFAFETSFSRKPIYYELIVKELNELEILGAVHVQVRAVNTDQLHVKMSGASYLSIEDLSTESLVVELPVGGVLDMEGYAAKQRISIHGPANYRASKLKSYETRIEVTGPGSATVWVVDRLDAVIRGLGLVKYYGSPRVRKEISGLGSLSRVG